MTQEMTSRLFMHLTLELHEKLRQMYHERIQPKKINAVKTQIVTERV